MKTRNILNLFTLFGASLFLIKGASAIPECINDPNNTKNQIIKESTPQINSAGYCMYNKNLCRFDGNNATPVSVTEQQSLYFITTDNYLDLSSSSSSESPTSVELYSVSTNGSVSSVESIEKGYYLDFENKIIYCDNNKCKIIKKEVLTENSFLKQNSLSGKGLIKIGSSNDDPEQYGKVEDGYYLNALGTPQLILCKSGKCDDKTGAAENVYLNAAAESQSLEVIVCKKKEVEIDGKKEEKTVCNVESVAVGNESPSHFINSSEIDGSTKPLISCKDKCESVAVESNVYYENSLSQFKIEKAESKVIYCAPNSGQSRQCNFRDGSDGDVFIGKKDGEGETDGVIICSKKTDGVSSRSGVNRRAEARAGTDTATTTDNDPADGVICVLKEPSATDNYYLNAGYDSSTNQLILCDGSDKGCVPKKVNPGYYKSAITEENKHFIECVTECKLIENDSNINACPDDDDFKDVNESTYCKTITDASTSTTVELKFYDKTGNGTLYNPDSSELYIYTTLSKFPSINSGITTLFKITKYGIERFITNGVIGVSPASHTLVDVNGEEVGDAVELFECSNTSKLCVKRSSCNTNTYMFNSENGKAFYCDGDGKLQDVSNDSGYYVDKTTTVNGRTPYIISCNAANEKPCEHILPSIASYYLNSGNDRDSNALIYCDGSNCYTTAATVGNYIGNQQAGVITCSSQSNCEYREASSAGNNVNYVNAGISKSTYALIACNRKSCTPKAARTGYYFTNVVTSLISCENNVCNKINPTVNRYHYADTTENGKNYIINCTKAANSVVCAKEDADTGSYLSNKPNVLIRCTAGGSCRQEVAKPGYYQSAVKITINSSRDLSSVGGESELVSNVSARDSTTTYNIIECTTTNCELLSAEELANIPVCEYNADKCYITIDYALGRSTVNSISAGGLCTNADRSVFYFATDTIVVAPSVIAGTISTYVYTTTTTNCLVVGKKYSDLYYTVGSEIYRLNEGSISRFYENGYYFIDIEKNALINGNNIDNYNDENIKLYVCNGTSCRILDNPENSTYIADANKRILKFNVNSDSYSFAYEKDIICIFANNKCTPNADLKGREFCITYKGELALAASDIKNRETGDCFKAPSIGNYIYGYNQQLYRMNIYTASIVDEVGYDIVSLSTNTTISPKDYKNRLISGNAIRIYGCHSNSCKIYQPEEGVYYYDDDAEVLVKKENDSWVAPSTSGYALISINPNEKFIYKFKIDEDDKATLLSKASNGYYYTVDNEMYECSEDDKECIKITDTDYYFTNTGEIYYCVYDSENLEKTECTKQSCYVGQNYYISDNYYRCEGGSYLTPIKSRSCKYDEKVIVNFPTILKEEFPSNIKQAIENIEKNNNSTAVAPRSNKKYLSVVPAIYTNCTYNVEETDASYDLVCINNYVAVNEEDDALEICSIENLGYVECVDDEANPEKCNPSSAFTRVVFNFFTVAFTVFASLYLMLF